MGNYCYGPQAKEKLQVTVSGFCAKSHSNSFCSEVIKSLQKLKQRKVHGIVFQETNQMKRGFDERSTLRRDSIRIPIILDVLN